MLVLLLPIMSFCSAGLSVIAQAAFIGIFPMGWRAVPMKVVHDSFLAVFSCFFCSFSSGVLCENKPMCIILRWVCGGYEGFSNWAFLGLFWDFGLFLCRFFLDTLTILLRHVDDSFTTVVFCFVCAGVGGFGFFGFFEDAHGFGWLCMNNIQCLLPLLLKEMLYTLKIYNNIRGDDP